MEKQRTLKRKSRLQANLQVCLPLFFPPKDVDLDLVSSARSGRPLGGRRELLKVSHDVRGGTLPDGVYWKFTEIHFCCRTDGDKDVAILLPSNIPFFLLAYKSAKCQMVKWAVASVEWIYYYTHNKEEDQANGSYPYNAAKIHPTIYYCYYRGEKA